MKTTLPQRLRAAADAMEELSAMSGFGHNPDKAPWSASELRHEAQVMETESPW